MNELKQEVYVPEHNSIMLVKRPPDVGENDFYGALMEMANDLRRANMTVVLIGVDDFADIALLNEEDMEKRGWVRADRVLAFKNDPWPGAAERRQALLDEERAALEEE